MDLVSFRHFARSSGSSARRAPRGEGMTTDSQGQFDNCDDTTAVVPTTASPCHSEAERLATLMDNSLVWIFELDLFGCLTQCNRRGLYALGASSLVEAQAMPFEDRLGENYREPLRNLMQAVRRGESGELEFTDAEEQQWYTASFLPVRDRDGQVMAITGIAQEITRRKMAERALRQKEQILRQVCEHIREVFWLCDPELSQVFYLSPGFEEIWGIPREVIIQDPDHWTSCIHPEDAERVKHARIGQAAGLFDETYRIVRPDGELRWIRDRAYPVVDSKGQIIRLTGIAEDITSRRLSEEALAQSEERYRSFFNTMRDAMLFVSPLGLIEDANPAFLDLFGYAYEDLMDQPYTALSPPSWEDWEARQIRPQLDTRGFSGNYEKEMRTSHGELLPVSVQMWLLAESGQDQPSMLVQVRDLTQQKRMEHDKRHLEAQLLQAQKMETIGTLAGGIAHDFNNILTPILGFARMAKEDDGAERQMDLDQVLKAANRARELVKQILSFSRQEEVTREVIKIHPILREVKRMLRSILPSTIEILYHVEHHDDAILGNPTQLIQILMNLGTNAYQAIGEQGGTLEMSSRRLVVDQSNRPQHPNLSGGLWIEIEVRDTGKGMDPATLERIFDAFFTTKKSGEGTGLGLSVVQSIVNNHCGVITVDSEVSKGTTFHIYFPSVVSEEAEEVCVEEPMRGNARVLFVDDEGTITLMCKKMLERLGYKVETFNDSLAALQRFRSAPETIDVLVTDQIMPGLTGLDLARRAKEVRPDLPIVVITGYSERVTPESCHQAGVHDYLLKPIVGADLSKAIQAAIAASRG